MEMSEASKKRMEEGAIDYSKTVAPESIEQWVAGGYRNGYQAGMQDPDAGPEITKEFILEIIEEWQMIWRNQNINPEDTKRYRRRALSVDANMRGSLARMIHEKIREAKK